MIRDSTPRVGSAFKLGADYLRLLERKEPLALIASLPGSVWLEKAAPSLISAVGADVMRRLASVLFRLQGQYERSRCSRGGCISALQFKPPIRLYHLLFKVQKRVPNRHLSLLRPNELVLQLQSQFGDLLIRSPSLLASFNKLPDLFAQFNAAADEADGQIGVLKNSTVVHTNRPFSKRFGE
jgi:hypothetical protein